MKTEKKEGINGLIIAIKENSTGGHKNRLQVVTVLLTGEVVNVLELYKKDVTLLVEEKIGKV